MDIKLTLSLVLILTFFNNLRDPSAALAFLATIWCTSLFLDLLFVFARAITSSIASPKSLHTLRTLFPIKSHNLLMLSLTAGIDKIEYVITTADTTIVPRTIRYTISSTKRNLPVESV